MRTDDVLARVRAGVVARGDDAVDEREADSARRFLAEVDRLLGLGLDPFDEHADLVHITGSAIVVSERGVLMHKHKRLGLWLQPGGHVDAGETPWDGARRETLEETGIVAEHPVEGPVLVHVDVHSGGRGHSHLDLRYLLTAAPADPCPPEGESQEVAWLSWSDAIAIADPGLVGALRILRPD